jgi:dephospho-CoA kinase
MKPTVLAFSGSIASGKSTLSGEVAEALQWSRVSFGDYVRSVARNQGLAESREVLQAIRADLVERDIEGFCRAVLAQANWQPGQPIVIDGIRHTEVLDSLRQIVAPTALYLIFVTVDEATRSARLLEREATSLEKHQYLEQDSTERQVKFDLAHLSDLIIDNRHSLRESVKQIVDWLKTTDSA